MRQAELKDFMGQQMSLVILAVYIVFMKSRPTNVVILNKRGSFRSFYESHQMFPRIY